MLGKEIQEVSTTTTIKTLKRCSDAWRPGSSGLFQGPIMKLAHPWNQLPWFQISSHDNHPPFLSQTYRFLSELLTLTDGWGCQGFQDTGFPLTAITLSYRLYWQYLTQICFPSLSDPTSICATGGEVECEIDFFNGECSAADSNPSGDALAGLQLNLSSLALSDSLLGQKDETLSSSFA